MQCMCICFNERKKRKKKTTQQQQYQRKTVKTHLYIGPHGEKRETIRIHFAIKTTQEKYNK